MNLSHYNDYLPPEIETYADRMERLHPEEKRRIYGITLQITEDCCMACTYCYQHNKTKTIMSFDTAKNIIDKLLNNEFEFANIKNTVGLIVDFIGGEPFMEIDLIEQIVEYTVNKMIKEDNKNINQQHNEWNATRIHSKNINGVVNRNDDLPGYLGKDDYTLYFHNIMETQKQDLGKFKPPHWEVMKKNQGIQNAKNVGKDVQQCKKGEISQNKKNEMFTISESQEIKK